MANRETQVLVSGQPFVASSMLYGWAIAGLIGLVMAVLLYRGLENEGLEAAITVGVIAIAALALYPIMATGFVKTMTRTGDTLEVTTMMVGSKLERYRVDDVLWIDMRVDRDAGNSKYLTMKLSGRRITLCVYISEDTCDEAELLALGDPRQFG
ncbi:MAG: hypothetical protein AAFY81_10780 [Pseudomonadota bacterium]